jgi:hypothetical protein
MCTTRELAAQNLAVLRRMAKYTQITSTSTAEDGEGTARGRTLVEQVGLNPEAQIQTNQYVIAVWQRSGCFERVYGGGDACVGCWLLLKSRHGQSAGDGEADAGVRGRQGLEQMGCHARKAG